MTCQTKVRLSVPFNPGQIDKLLSIINTSDDWSDLRDSKAEFALRDTEFHLADKDDADWVEAIYTLYDIPASVRVEGSDDLDRVYVVTVS